MNKTLKETKMPIKYYFWTKSKYCLQLPLHIVWLLYFLRYSVIT